VGGTGSGEVVSFGIANTVGDTTYYATVFGINNGIGIGNVDNVTVGNANGINAGCTDCIAIGHANHVIAGTTLVNVLVVGHGATSYANETIVIGSNSTVFIGAASQVIGYNHTVGLLAGFGSTNIAILGDTCTVGDTCHTGVALGSTHIVDAAVSNFVALGDHCSLTGSYALAFGSGAAAGANQCVFATSASAGVAIHEFLVRGYTFTGVAVDTLKAIDFPSPGETGLTIVFNAGGGGGGVLSNKLIKAAVAPPGGSLLLYISP
jgi:hypothetical protein